VDHTCPRGIANKDIKSLKKWKRVNHDKFLELYANIINNQDASWHSFGARPQSFFLDDGHPALESAAQLGNTACPF
jgi:hypothetical protein